MSEKAFFACVLEILRENGYKNTTIDKIVEKTKIGRTTLFRKYKTKENLIYSAIYEMTVSTADLTVVESLTYQDIEKDLPLLLKNYLELYIKQMPVYRLFMIPSLNDQELNQKVYAKLSSLIQHFEDYLTLMAQKGLIHQFDFRIFAHMTFSTILNRSLTLTDKEVILNEGDIDRYITNLSNDLLRLLNIS